VNVDTRFLAYLIWGLGTLVVYGVVLFKRRHAYVQHNDARSRRDLIEAIALFIVAFGASLAITFVLFGEAGSGIRGWASAVALGAFSAAGLVMATERHDDPVKA